MSIDTSVLLSKLILNDGSDGHGWATKKASHDGNKFRIQGVGNGESASDGSRIEVTAAANRRRQMCRVRATNW
jgi:hypothetical protein